MLTVSHLSFSVSSAASTECHLKRWAKHRLWRRRRRRRRRMIKRQPRSSWQDGWCKECVRNVIVALGAVMFPNIVGGSVIPEQHMPRCDSSSSIPACLFVTVSCLGLFERAELQVQRCVYMPRQTWHLVYTAALILSATPFGPVWDRQARTHSGCLDYGGWGEKGHAVFTQAALQINSSPANVIILNLVYLLCKIKRWRLLEFKGGDRYKNSRSDPQISALQAARSSHPYRCLSEERTLVSHMNVCVWRR